MPRPICVKCSCEMVAQAVGVAVKDKATSKFESTLWFGDHYKCPQCQNEIVTGFGSGLPLSKYPNASTLVEFEYE